MPAARQTCAPNLDLGAEPHPPNLQGPVLFSGAGLSVSPESSTAFVALNAGPTAYGGEPGKAVTVARLAGRGVGLVALIQVGGVLVVEWGPHGEREGENVWRSWWRRREAGS